MSQMRWILPNRSRAIPWGVLAIACTLCGCTCNPHGSTTGDGASADSSHPYAASTSGSAGGASNQTRSTDTQDGSASLSGATGTSDPGLQTSGNQPNGGTIPQPGEYPLPIMGHAVRLDKPVQEPQPGYLIIPDDKPADEFMSGLPPTGQWKSFVMAGTSLSDNGLAFFPRFPAVHTLDASGTRVSDEGLRYLEKAKSLQVLSLRNTRITDAGLQFLKHIKTLRSLEVTGTQVTEQGIEELRQALPGLQVQR